MGACLGMDLQYRNMSMTGTLNFQGDVLDVGGMAAKLEHAVVTKRSRVMIPHASHNDATRLVVANADKGWEALELIPVKTIWDVLDKGFPCDGGGGQNGGECGITTSDVMMMMTTTMIPLPAAS